LFEPLAERQQYTGRFRYEGRGRKGRMDFTYEVAAGTEEIEANTASKRFDRSSVTEE
jgi:hypothetical protein